MTGFQNLSKLHNIHVLLTSVQSGNTETKTSQLGTPDPKSPKFM